MLAHLLVLALCTGVFALSTAGMLKGAEPFATWFYPLAWYPTLLAVDAVIRMRTGRWYLLGEAPFAASVLLWSLPFWLFFEVLNLRMANWYYVFLPDGFAARWTGIVVSFATVLPAILVSRRALDAFGVGRDLRSPPLSVRPPLPAVLQATGVLFFVVSLLWPRVFFPLIWGGVTLLVDPWVHRRDPGRSLLGALERGRPGVIVQLLVGGLAIGLLWELYNTQARGKWIYTVPGLEDLKLFEMPVLGFLGFPVLALDGWAVWNALVLARLAAEPGSEALPGAAVEPDGEPTAAAAADPAPGSTPGPRATRAGRAVAVPLSVAFGFAALAAMDRWTVTSTTPRLDDLVGTSARTLELAGYDAFALAEEDPRQLAGATGTPEPTARDWVRRARLATLRGIGTDHAAHLEAVGVRTLAELAVADAATLTDALREAGMPDPRVPRVRVWIRAAREDVGGP